jgi:hypothetical protein
MGASRGLGLLFFVSALGCDPEPLQTCGEIPQDGCPSGRGGTCDDPYCAALYDCVDGDWTEVESCPDNDVGGAGGAGAGSGQGGACTSEVFDHSAEVEGCTPDLQEPDCPSQAAEVCGGGACLTGCIDFYMCLEAGWELVGFCTEDGELEVVQGTK